jgi:hypothetical protein
LLLVPIFHPPQDSGRSEKLNTELADDACELAGIEGRNRVDTSVRYSFEHHVVVGVPQSWAPQEMRLDRFDNSRKDIEGAHGFGSCHLGAR